MGRAGDASSRPPSASVLLPLELVVGRGRPRGVHVGRLRKSINRGRETDPIRTVRGAGYAFDERFVALN